MDPDAQQTLNNLLTVEGFLFAAFAIGVALAQPSRSGRSPFFARGWFGWCQVAVLALIAAAGLACWYRLYNLGTVSSTGDWVRGAGLACGIAAQPIFAAAINWQARKS